MVLIYDELAKSDNPKIKNFVKTFKFWEAFFKNIKESDSENPNIQTLLTNIKLVVFCGYAEALAEFPVVKISFIKFFIGTLLRRGNNINSTKKFLNFFDKLTCEEKLYFNISHTLKKINQKAQRIYERLDKTGDEKLLKKLLQIHDHDNETKSENYKQCLIDYLEGNTKNIDIEFKKRMNLFYGMRSVLVHEGTPVLNVSTGSFNLFMGEYENAFFSSLVDFEVFFYCAIYRNALIAPPDINKQIVNFLLTQNPLRYPALDQQVIQKLKRA